MPQCLGMSLLSSIEQFSEDPRKHIELVRGVILESPRVGARHFLVARRLTEILECSGLVSGICANLVLDGDPLRPLVREPDVYVLREENGPEDDGLFQYAENTLLVAEIVYPGSGATDWVEKMSEYAEAGIAHYWIIEFYVDGKPHLYTFKLGLGGYGNREHWGGEVDIEVAGVRVQFDVQDLALRSKS
jgi:Uma2 family endonuclease